MCIIPLILLYYMYYTYLHYVGQGLLPVHESSLNKHAVKAMII
jgi:hypothetical protein